MKEFESITIHRKIGCGNIYCIFVENDGDFMYLIIKGDNAKEAPCGEVWFSAMGRILTYALRRSIYEGDSKRAIVKQLLNNRCNMIIPNAEHIVSCPDAIGKMVLEYLKARGVDEEETQEEKTTRVS